MSAQQTKQFQQGERVIPAAAEKAPKYYQAEDDSQAKKVCTHATADRLNPQRDRAERVGHDQDIHTCAHTKYTAIIGSSLVPPIFVHIKREYSPLTSPSSSGPQEPAPLQAPRFPPARYRLDPPRWPFPWQARCSPQEPRPGCSPRHRPLQGQRCPSQTRQRPLRYRNKHQGRHLRH